MRSPNLQISVLVGFLILLMTPHFLFAQYAISTVAGGGPNNLAELSASIGSPASIAFDAHGNAYIADPSSSHIFEVSAGTLAVVAGNGTAGYSGDGGLATTAALNHPEGVYVDGSGNIFIADTDNQVIREVVASTGIITTVAGTGNPGYGGDGGLATSAQFYDPNGVFVDGSENIYVADTDNCLIRKFTIGGNISTVAGNPLGSPSPCSYSGDGGLATSAQLDAPEGVFVDGSGNIFIADTANSLIREVTAATGDIQTVAGNFYDFDDVCTYSGDGNSATGSNAYLCWPAGVFLDKSGDIFIADTLNQVIREVTAATGDISTVAGDNALGAGYSGNGGSPILAQLNNPNATHVDSSGDIFIADTGNFVIREVTAGTISTIIGNNTLSYSGDSGLAVNAELSDPAGVAIDAAGNFYIADAGNSVIRAVNTGTTPITIAGVTIQPSDVATVAGSYYVPAGDALCDYSGDGGAPTSAQLCSPGGVVIDSLGNIIIADTQNDAIRVVNTGTQNLIYWGTTVLPGDIATVAGNGTVCSGSAAACGDGGPAASAELNHPYGIAVDSAENIFIADTDDFVIREVQASGTSAGIITTVAGNYVQCTESTTTSCGDGTTATTAQLSYAYGVFVDPADNIYIADAGDNRIRAVNLSAQPVTIAGVMIPAGDINTIAGNGTPGYAGDGAAATQANLDNPSGVFVDLSGDIFVADTDNSAIREVVAATGFIQTVAGIAPTGNGISSNPGFSGDGGQATLAALNSPTGVFGTSAGIGCTPSPCLFIADTANQRIRKLVPAIFVTVTPNPVNVVVGAEQQFVATVTGNSNTAVTWQVNGIAGGSSALGIGTISTTGLYQAPATVPTPATVTLTAISAADGTTSGSAQATIVTASTNVTVTVSSGGATQVYTGTTQQFSATVTGSTNQAVNWYVEGSSGGDTTFGTIDSTGLYTAPAAVPTPATIAITAFSQAASNAFGSASITIIAAPAAADPAPQTISPGGQANYSLLLNENTGAPGQPITLSCLQSTLPAGATCTFNPTTITPGPQAVPFSLTVAVPAASASLNYPKSLRLIMYGAFLPMLGIVSVGAGLRNKRRRWLYPPLVCMLLILLNACGGSSSSSTGTGSGPQTYNVKIQGTTAAQPNPVTITIAGLTVQ